MGLTLFICGDVELNWGPKNTKYYYFLICQWNLNNLPDFSKLSLIEVYNTHHNFDMIYLPETYLDSSNADDDTRFNLNDFPLIRAKTLIVARQMELVFILKNIWLFPL